MKLEVKHFFDAAHQLPDSEFLLSKGCARLHGHTYAVVVEVEGESLEAGMVVDFKAIKDTIDELDHQFINEIFKQDTDYANRPPTAEVISEFLADKIEARLRGRIIPGKIKIRLCEGYKGQERSSWVIYEQKLI